MPATTKAAPTDVDPHVLRKNAYCTDQNMPPRLWRCIGKVVEDGIALYGYEDVKYPDQVRWERLRSGFIQNLDYVTQGRNLP